jgi:hypothetical protein
MTARKKKVDFTIRPKADADTLPKDPDQWVNGVKTADKAPPQPVDAGPHKRLTLNLPTSLHTAFKGRCVVEGVTIQDKVRILIEHELAEEKPTAG